MVAAKNDSVRKSSIISDLTKEIRRLEQEKNTLNLLKIDAEDLLKQQQEKTTVLEGQNEQYKVEIQKLTEDFAEVKQRLQDTETLLQQYSDENQTLINEINNLKQQTEQPEEIGPNKISEQNNKIRQLEQEKNTLNLLKIDAEKLLKQQQEKTSLLESQNENYKVKIQQLTEELTETESLKKLNHDLTADCKEKLQRIEVLEKDIKDILCTIESVTGENNRLKQTCDSMSIDNTNLINTNNDLSERYNTLNIEFEGLKSEINKAYNDIETQKISLELTNAENIKLKDELLTLQNEFSSAQVQLDVCEKNIDSLQSQIQMLNSEKEELKPYMYLIDAKKEEEAKELAFNQAKDTLQECINKANCVLSDLKHDEVLTPLSSAISIALEQIESAKDITAIDEAKQNLENSINLVQFKENELIEEERKREEELRSQKEEERKREEELRSQEEEKRKQEEKLRGQEEEKRKQEEKLRGQEEEKRKSEEEPLVIVDEQSISTEKDESIVITEDVESFDEKIFDDDSLHIVFDYGMIPADKLSIPEVYDVKEEKTINARDFFSQNENELILWRRNLQEEYLLGKSRFICPECKQPVKISGHKLHRGRVCYFAHFKDSDDCPYKTGTNRSKEEIERLKYSLVQESDRHKRLKAAIASALNGIKSKDMGVTNVECEKRINSDIPYLNWRRPDVYAEYNGKRFVFELQLSTTFVSVIVDRDIFYRLNDYNIIWVFNFEDNEEYVNLQNLMCKDIYYANKRNVYIFDSEAEKESEDRGELVLKCRWLNENGLWSKDDFVTLNMFKFDDKSHKPYIVDADTAYLSKYPEYAERRKLLEHSREYLLKALMERQRLEKQTEEKKNLERYNLQNELLNGNDFVERFASGTKYGYRYKGTTILPAKYTSAEIMGEKGYAKVGFNRKIGLVRKDGKEIVPVEYKNINVINSHHGIVLASYKHIQLYLGEDSFNLCSDFDEKKQNITQEAINGKVKYILQTSQYTYSYTRSHYGDHPICHKSFAGYEKSELFSFIEDKDFCILWVKNKTYLLSKNQLSEIKGRYSEIISIGIDLVFIAKNLDNNLWGVIDFHGNVIANFLYKELIPTNSEYLIVKDTSDRIKYGVIDYKGRELITPQFEALICLDSKHFGFRENNLWGICDRTGIILHEPEYTYICGNSLGGLRAALLKSYVNKWSIQNNIPLYHDTDVKLLLLNDKGEITYTEKSIGQYVIRHSGDLYSIISSDGTEKVNYSLSSVEFISNTEAIIKHIDNKSGLFLDGKCVFFDGCIGIESLSDNVYSFINQSGKIALGNSKGPKSDYLYNPEPSNSFNFVKVILFFILFFGIETNLEFFEIIS